MREGYDELLELTKGEAVYYCACELGVSDGVVFDQCVFERAAHPAPPIAECTKDVYATAGDAVWPALSCRLDSARRYVECLDGASCFDLRQADLCVIERTAREFDCPTLDRDAYLEQQVQCLGKAIFECADGLRILRERVCDATPDCSDGSDEADCPVPPTPFGE